MHREDDRRSAAHIQPARIAPSRRLGAPSTKALREPTRPMADGGPALAEVPARTVCRIVRQLVAEMVLLSSGRVLHRRDARRSGCHVRQIAMYLCHVVLRISLSDIGLAFGRDRTTVGHACNVVEDRRDNAAFDEFVTTAERIVLSVFGPAGLADHD